MQSKTQINGMLNKLFWHFFDFIFISNTFRIGFLLVENKIDNIDFHEMNIL